MEAAKRHLEVMPVDDDTHKDKSAGGLRAPARVMVYHEAWEDVDLEGQAAAVKAAAPGAAPSFFWNRRRKVGVVVLLLVVLGLALGLDIGLGMKNKGTAGAHITAPAVPDVTPAAAAAAPGTADTGKATAAAAAATPKAVPAIGERAAGRPTTKGGARPRAAVTSLPPPRPKVTGATARDAAQLASLLQLKAALDTGGVLDQEWTEISGQNRGYCKWKYVTCDKAGEVVEMVNLTTDSYVMVLTGSLPPAAAFAGLPGLLELDIRMNTISGPLPPDWAKLAGQLEVLRLDQNFLEGPLPEEWADLGVGLKVLTLWDNDLSGPLPESWADMVLLEELDLSYNALTGPLPEAWSSIGSLGPGLRELLLDVNELSGPLPESWAALSSLEKLFLSENSLAGVLPDIGANWPHMKQLWLEYNNFEGKLPESYAAMTNLEQLALNDNAFVSTVPAAWANMGKLLNVFLFNNPGLSGCLPKQWQQQLEVSPGFAIDDFVLDETNLEGFC